MLPLHRICHQGLRMQQLAQCLDETRVLHPLQLVIFSHLKLNLNTNKNVGQFFNPNSQLATIFHWRELLRK